MIYELLHLPYLLIILSFLEINFLDYRSMLYLNVFDIAIMNLLTANCKEC